LDPNFENISENLKFDLSGILGKILCNFHLMKNHVDAIRSCRYLISIIKNPWDNHLLPKLLFGDASQEDGNISNYNDNVQLTNK